MNKKTAAGLIFAAAACICAFFAIHSYWEGQTAGSGYDDIRDAAGSVRDPESSDTMPDSGDGTQSESTEANESASAETETVPINFDEVQASCPDAYAWIRIDGTNVDYPIVQTDGDQSYYLTHSAEQKKSAAGAIYTENLNSKDFTDPVTVIYGHNMKNGSMFRTLHNYEDRAFFNEHREIFIYLPQKVLHFRVFAAYNTDDRHILKSYDFSTSDGYQSYLDSVFSQRSMDAIVADDCDVTPADRIIILSTCNGNSDQRFLVQAVEID